MISSRFLSGGTRTAGECDAQHIVLARAPTNAQGSGSDKPEFLDQANDAGRAFSFGDRLAENIELPRGALDEGPIDRLEDTYEFESGWTTSAVEGSPASSEE